MELLGDHAYIKIYLKGEELKISTLEQFEIKNEINQHAMMKLGVVIYEEDIQKYSEMITSLKPIQAVLTDDKKAKTIFEGLVYEMQIEVVGLVAFLSLTGISYSYLLDIQVRNRSFQDQTLTYGQLISKVLKSYSHANYKFSNNHLEQKVIGKPYIQYHETDWMFLKRLVSKLNIGIVAPIELEGLKIWLEAINQEQIGDITPQVISYKVKKDFKAYKHMQENDKKDVLEVDYVEFEILSSQIMTLGTQVIFNNIKLYVKDVRIVLENAEIKFYYTLGLKNGLCVPKIKNQQLVGASLNGKVIDVKEHVVLVHLDIDAAQATKEAYWFPFATVSASANNVGWYFMPEIGDGVRVYFEDGKEENGVAIQAVPLKPSYKDPSIRYISTIHGKEIKIAPNGIYITAKNDSLYIKLDDKEGVSICSDTNINIVSQEAINILSDTKIELAAETINMTTGENGETTVAVNEDILVDAKHVNVNGK